MLFGEFLRQWGVECCRTDSSMELRGGGRLVACGSFQIMSASGAPLDNFGWRFPPSDNSTTLWPRLFSTHHGDFSPLSTRRCQQILQMQLRPFDRDVRTRVLPTILRQMAVTVSSLRGHEWQYNRLQYVRMMNMPARGMLLTNPSHGESRIFP